MNDYFKKIQEIAKEAEERGYNYYEALNAAECISGEPTLDKIIAVLEGEY